MQRNNLITQVKNLLTPDDNRPEWEIFMQDDMDPQLRYETPGGQLLTKAQCDKIPQRAKNRMFINCYEE